MSESKPRSGVHARLTVEPDCPLAAVASRWSVLRFIQGTAGDTAPQVVVDACPHDLVDDPLVDPIGTADGATVCRVDTERLDDCGHDPCLAWGFEFLPIRPYNVRWQDGRLNLSFVATDDGECRSVMDALSSAGFDPELRQLTPDAIDASADVETAVVDLSALTDRQRTVARRAAEDGYFDGDGHDPEAIAGDLDITKSTLSEHLRVIQAEFFEQVFDS